MARAIGPKAKIEYVRHPSTDRIRWVKSVPSVTSHRIDDQGVLTVELERFGRKAVPELRKVLEDAFRSNRTVSTVVVDLRSNHGGDFDRMLRVASLFTGHVPGAVRLVGPDRLIEVSVPKNAPVLHGTTLRVLVGPRTASSAEVLTALLKVHAGAQVVGTATYGKNYLSRVVPVSHDLRLLVPGARIEVPGTTLVGGVVLDIKNASK
jgi:C-terminal processing protease CtpA/Prc